MATTPPIPLKRFNSFSVQSTLNRCILGLYGFFFQHYNFLSFSYFRFEFFSTTYSFSIDAVTCVLFSNESENHEVKEFHTVNLQEISKDTTSSQKIYRRKFHFIDSLGQGVILWIGFSEWKVLAFELSAWSVTWWCNCHIGLMNEPRASNVLVVPFRQNR